MKRVVLVGSGHAHLEVLRFLSANKKREHQYLLISPNQNTYYSGLIPRLIMGDVDVDQLTIHSALFAKSKNVEFIQDSILSINGPDRTITLLSGKIILYDILSINIGGTADTLPSQSPGNTISLRPFDSFIANWNKVIPDCSSITNQKFIIVGGGAAAVEVATALRIRLNKNQSHKSEVHLVSKSPRLCKSYSQNISKSILKSLKKINIDVHLNEPVTEIREKHILLSSGERIDFDTVFLAIPNKPSSLLPKPIGASLEIAANIFAVGDCALIYAPEQLPRSGVMAVHQGRHLVQSILMRLNNQTPKNFIPRKKSLNILITGEKSAHLIWGSFYFVGKWAFQLKNWIDTRYMNCFKID